jgi:mono/diheme cytochrome c family protein
MKWMVIGALIAFMVAIGTVHYAHAQVRRYRSADSIQGIRQVLVWLQGAEFTETPENPAPENTEELRVFGQAVYVARCTPCHGLEGNGDGTEAKNLAVPPTDFTRGIFKFRSTPTGTLPTNDDLFRTVSRGVHGTSMLPWPVVSERSRWALIYYIRTFSGRFAQEEPAKPISISSVPDFTPELIVLGRALYGELQCQDCHGFEGRGDGVQASKLKDYKERPIRPRNFAEGRFKAGSTPRDVYRTLFTGLEGTPMPAYELDETYLWPVVAYVLTMLPEKPVIHDPAKQRQLPVGILENMHPEERLGMTIDLPMISGWGLR